ncbi:N-acetylglucosaminyldiphosphoundecaprenol N-acetyl-beta-D-mannosaminyltransferase [[Clostridium] aminophilum]|uniref:N-acetylglucosaminyldiphosphoundecaprenol N-acetyl-beta-D-mannosaminyltransferase n=1 Tax=[Clostridium] aminophilum TaxID=1526 RepID=A0A1I0B5Y7_9FIRM|nr:WecB/TagA/CpsF family glycosyltransferase [[Clostridium] aminophilum]SET02141.1 N-acetylglucosaminyldiphosphoundecaprenol N-acetyl-beta-D-mannosaminyltransferase [[Clostridium] aminophilum]
MENIYQRKRDITICGVGFCPTTRVEFVREAFSMPTSPVSGTIDLIGVPGVNSAKADPKVAEMYASSSFAAIDGMPIVKIARKKGFNCERCSGPDIMGMMFEESVRQGKTHYLYGGKDDEVLIRLRTNLERDYPGIQIVGMYSPPFRPLTDEEDEKICSEINFLHPDFLWVGIGAPKQEMWMWNHREKIHGTVMLGVGAAFNFFAGTLDKSPEWMEEAGLEWLYRLTKEPKRLWKRYVLGGFKWLYYRAEAKVKGTDK